jgi:signal transduction histidine kinase
VPGRTPDRFAQLQWLVRLRWYALIGVTLACSLGVLGLVPGINLPVMALAIVLGIGTNLWVLSASHKYEDTDAAHVGQALFDIGALTLVLWAAGGADGPFVAFYVFPVLLAALLGGGRALWSAGLASAAGLLFQHAAVLIPELRIAHWDPSPTVNTVLNVGAVGLTMAITTYFAARFTIALRRQVRARREADTMLHIAFESIGAGLEVIGQGAVAFQNPLAVELLGARVGQPWQWPEQAEPPDDPLGPMRAEICLTGPGGQERIYEMLGFALAGRAQQMVMYIDHTSDLLNQRQLQFTERLASLGRTVQGVAHELNTPLATIQTLGRDVVDALACATVDPALKADLGESATMIVDEVQRCRRITHALLGRAEHLDERHGGPAPLSASIQRAIAVVYTHARAQVELELSGAAQAQTHPLDPIVQVFVNLLQNARDAAPDGRVWVRGCTNQTHCTLWVRDAGPGLEPGTRPHLFEPFFTTKAPGQGTGLGLYTSYALIQGLGGTLTLADHPEGGAVATITLPLQPTPAENHL